MLFLMFFSPFRPACSFVLSLSLCYQTLGRLSSDLPKCSTLIPVGRFGLVLLHECSGNFRVLGSWLSFRVVPLDWFVHVLCFFERLAPPVFCQTFGSPQAASFLRSPLRAGLLALNALIILGRFALVPFERFSAPVLFERFRAFLVSFRPFCNDLL